MQELLKVKDAVEISKLSKDQVIELQTALNKLEFPCGKADGVVGPKTKGAFNQFKEHYKLTHPGLIGQTTVEFIAALIQGEDDVAEGEDPAQIIVLEKPLIIPDKVNWNDFKCPISKYFCVGEATNWDRRRIPYDVNIQNNILELAAELDKVRYDYKGAIGVNSWYRPPAVNRAIGGASRSQHLTGKAVDIRPADGKNLLGFQEWLDLYWHDALGYGARRGFVHLDRRGGHGWKLGDRSKRVRWNY